MDPKEEAAAAAEEDAGEREESFLAFLLLLPVRLPSSPLRLRWPPDSRSKERAAPLLPPVSLLRPRLQASESLLVPWSLLEKEE